VAAVCASVSLLKDPALAAATTENQPESEAVVLPSASSQMLVGPKSRPLIS
jgi:hypothetical protein